MDVNNGARFLDERGALRFFASKLAPTLALRCSQCLRNHSINNANNSDCDPTSSFRYRFLRCMRTVSGEMPIWLAVEFPVSTTYETSISKVAMSASTPCSRSQSQQRRH